MSYSVLRTIYVLFLLFAFFSALYEYQRSRERKMLVLVLLMSATITSELINFIPQCTILSLKYYVFSFIELLLLSLYFRITVVKSNLIFGIINTASALFFLFCYTRFNTTEPFPATYITFEGFCILMIAIYSLFKLAIADSEKALSKDFDFWFWSLVLGLWCLTYFFLGLENYVHLSGHTKVVIGIADWVANSIYYLSLGILFLAKKNMYESR